MKKIFIFNILSILLLGCSDTGIGNQEDIHDVKFATQQTYKSMENDQIDSLFYNYINSFEYKESNRLLSIFQAKFKISVSKDDFNTETEMLQWIGLNLEKTDFNSIEDAEVEWQPISDLLELSFNNHQEVLNFIRGSQPEISIYYFEKWLTKTSTDEDPCTKQLKTCEANALANLIDDVIFTAGGPDALNAYRSAHFFFNKSLTVCADNFELCVANS
ncbi:hypothetical protein MG290_07795 [Flavobacterium sp. CBA20B-1]|uniref:hypothetical protein n=1 Tax=unclassified Flavobacterium TaxID=196869 RepID=UPI002224D5EC|nr:MULTISPECIES: hypothetical protein [unclassified Flavobacterium]WCM40879.1 hypothetical protein MG290_07795 [Flavobacterium sp. CBA20B-1]